MDKTDKYRIARGLFFFAILAVLFILFFGSILFRDRMFGFRDDGYFYTPLYKHVQSYFDRGEWPLWDPYDNAGQPLAAMPTSAVFYPGKLVFFLPWVLPIAYETCFNLYILGHVALCFAAMYYLLTRFRVSPVARFIGAISYTFSGPVLFQYCNVIFLIGSAWLPFVLAFTDLYLRTGKPRALAGISVALAMMVFGGDPEMAYVSGLPTVALAFCYWRAGLIGSDTRPASETVPTRPRIPTLIRVGFFIGCAALFAGLLTAVQIVPSSRLTKLSDRAVATEPVSLWEIPRFAKQELERASERTSEHKTDEAQAKPKRGTAKHSDKSRNVVRERTFASMVLDGLLCRRIKEGGHMRNIYQFNTAPWTLPQLIWGKFGGRFFPHNSYFFIGMPNDRSWSVSLYMGVLPVLLALSVFRLRGRKRKKDASPTPLRHAIRIWGSWTLLFGLLAGMGAYAGFWFVRACLVLVGIDLDLTFDSCDPVGSLYWFMTVVLPGFASFRYPGKLFTVATFAFAILAGLGWDGARKCKWLKGSIQWLFLVGVGAIGFLLWRGSDFFYFAQIPSGSFFGPYMPEYAWRHTLESFVVTTALLGVYYLLFYARTVRKAVVSLLRAARLPIVPAISAMVVVMVAADLALVNRDLISTIPQAIYRVKYTYPETIHNMYAQRYPEKLAPPRMFHADQLPESFGSILSEHRFAERFYWENATLAPKMHMLHDVASLMSPGTMTYKTFADFINNFSLGIHTAEIVDISAFVDTSYWILGDDADVVSPNKQLIHTETVDRIYSARDPVEKLKANKIPIDSSLWSIKRDAARCHIFHGEKRLAQSDLYLFKFYKDGGRENPLPGEYARITSYKAQRVEFEIRLEKPGDVVIAEQYDADWVATVRAKGTDEASAHTIPIYQCLQFMRRLDLPPGEHVVVMKYRPTTLYRCAFVSMAAWLLLIFAGIGESLRFRARNPRMTGKKTSGRQSQHYTTDTSFFRASSPVDFVNRGR